MPPAVNPLAPHAVNLAEKLSLFSELWSQNCPKADEETAFLPLEPAGTPNTGDMGGDRIRR
ncbi:hypothetical protein [Streptomyces halobius]|uniref:Uncharacterized protein n=1 Tax=Streptomyces halobius TaxID=2879846 RepID=A0ABY4MCZ7_9ACTN|nr:hypothetical protein [Streptomyces halobius]UQA94634.1 hypothetical protein K9S39_24725 [Streptomyces halobius]